MVDSPTASRGRTRSAAAAPRRPVAQSRAGPGSQGAGPRGREEPGLEDFLPQEALGVRTLITRARSALLSSFDTELGPFGVTGAQFEIMKTLLHSGIETAAGLCRALHYDTGSMTRMLDRLEEKGLVCRERDTGDRRRVILRLTDAGETLIPRIRPALRRALRRHLAGFKPQEITSLKQYLGRLIENGERRETDTR